MVERNDAKGRRQVIRDRIDSGDRSETSVEGSRLIGAERRGVVDSPRLAQKSDSTLPGRSIDHPRRGFFRAAAEFFARAPAALPSRSRVRSRRPGVGLVGAGIQGVAVLFRTFGD